MRFKNRELTLGIINIILIVFIFLITTIRGCINEHNINKLNQELNAIRYKPIIIPVDSLRITVAKFDSVQVKPYLFVDGKAGSGSKYPYIEDDKR